MIRIGAVGVGVGVGVVGVGVGVGVVGVGVGVAPVLQAVSRSAVHNRIALKMQNDFLFKFIPSFFFVKLNPMD
jgi:hypothetical protein